MPGMLQMDCGIHLETEHVHIHHLPTSSICVHLWKIIHWIILYCMLSWTHCFQIYSTGEISVHTKLCYIYCTENKDIWHKQYIQYTVLESIYFSCLWGKLQLWFLTTQVFEQCTHTFSILTNQSFRPLVQPVRIWIVTKSKMCQLWYAICARTMHMV